MSENALFDDLYSVGVITGFSSTGSEYYLKEDFIAYRICRRVFRFIPQLPLWLKY